MASVVEEWAGQWDPDPSPSEAFKVLLSKVVRVFEGLRKSGLFMEKEELTGQRPGLEECWAVHEST